MLKVEKPDFSLIPEKLIGFNEEIVNTDYLYNGDNIHLLKNMLAQNKKVDVICIDPPYNTKKKDFKYLDSFSQETWFDSMYERLFIAKELLNESGSILINIDANAIAELKILCDHIFGKSNLITNFIWKKSHSVKNDKRDISTNHEYILFYAKNKKNLFVNLNPEVNEDYIKKSYIHTDTIGRFRTVPLHKEKNKKEFEVISPSGIKWIKRWNYNEVGFEKLLKEDLIYWGKSGNSCPTKKVYLKPKMMKTYSSILDEKKAGYTGDGAKDLKELGFSKVDFLYAKPVKLIKHLLEIASKDDAVIMDFFAGSGTTGQAIMELNNDEPLISKRKFILCTNNENNICDEVTNVRIERFRQKHEYNKTNFEYRKID